MLLGCGGVVLAVAGSRRDECRLHGRLHRAPRIRGSLYRIDRAHRNEVSTFDILKVFWENHDPTQGYRQGNDVGTQYRSAIFYTTAEQESVAVATRDSYARVVAARGYPEITTEIVPAADAIYYPAEDYHQQYLYKVPNGYRCHANTGLALPALSVG